MKTKDLTLLILLFLASCSGNKNVSDAYGNFEVDDVMISAEATGKLLIFNIEEGKKVSSGTLVAIIDTTDLYLKKRQFEAQKKAISARKENILAQIEVHKQQKQNLLIEKSRIESLMKNGAATQKQLDDINGQIEVVNRQMITVQTQNSSVISESEVVDAQIAQIEESIRKCKIYNPIDGMVLEKFAESNEIVSYGKPLYKIANLDEMILRVYVSGDIIPKIKLNQEVEVLIDQDKKTNRKMNGIITWVSQSAEFTPKTIQTKEERVNMVYAVKVIVKNDGSLKIGMPGEVNF